MPEMRNDKIIHAFHDRYRYGSTHCKPDLIRYAPRDGEFVPAGDGCLKPNHITMYRVGKKRAGRILDGRTWDEYPER